jgi:hypothetical protein
MRYCTPSLKHAADPTTPNSALPTTNERRACSAAVSVLCCAALSTLPLCGLSAAVWRGVWWWVVVVVVSRGRACGVWWGLCVKAGAGGENARAGEARAGGEGVEEAGNRGEAASSISARPNSLRSRI